VPKTPASNADEAVSATSTDTTIDESVVGKGHATPTRKEKEAARKRPLVPDDRVEARKQQRAAQQVQREKARIGMANGDEKYLPAKDRGPQRKFVRDYIDARWSIGEFLVPIMFLVILISFLPATFAVYSFIVLYAFLIFAIVDVIILGFLLKRRLEARFGAERVDGGYRWYGGMRALQMRIMRLPKPQVKRGDYPA
jgi:hypothetical protein